MIKFTIKGQITTVTIINKDMISGIDNSKPKHTEILCDFAQQGQGIAWRAFTKFKDTDRLMKVINSAGFNNFALTPKRKDVIVIKSGTDFGVSFEDESNKDSIELTLDKILCVSYTKRAELDFCDVSISMTNDDFLLIRVLFKVDEWITSIFGKYITDTFEG